TSHSHFALARWTGPRCHVTNFNGSDIVDSRSRRSGRKFCSPRRKPWVSASKQNSRESGETKSGGYAALRLLLVFEGHPMAYAMGYRSLAAPRQVRISNKARVAA